MKKKTEENSFVRMMSMFPEADLLFLEHFDPDCDLVSGSPMSSKTKEVWWGMTMISSLQEAFESGFQLVTRKNDKELNAKLEKHYEITNQG